MTIEVKMYNDPVIDAIPTPMITTFEADADVTAGALAYLDADGAITAAADDGDGNDNQLFGIILDTVESGQTANVFYHGYAGNKWSLTDAVRYRLAGVGVVVRPYV